MNSTIPVLIMVLGSVLFGQRLSVTQVFGLFLSCAGVLIIILHGQFTRLVALQFSQGDLIVFGAMVSFAFFSVWQRSFPTDVGRLGLLDAQLTVAVTILFPFLVFEYLGGARTTWSTAAVTEMLYVGVAAALLANLLYMFGIARVGPTRAGMFIHLVPLYGAAMSIALLGERLHFYHGVGMAGILAGLANMTGSKWPEHKKLKTTGAIR
jgi:drug/metabolite transporter (DMT)-like permease